MLVNLTQLRTFVAVAEEQHLTRASERISISQSAASAHVRAIEEALQTQLFIRTNRSLELTYSGQLILAQAKTLLHEATLLTSFARELKGKVQGTLVIGTSGDPIASRIGAVVAALLETHPLVQVDMRVRPSSSTRQGLKNGELDIGILLARPRDASFYYYELATVQFRIVGPVQWRERIEQAGWLELASLPWITPTDSSMAYAEMLVQMFDDKGLTLNSVARFDNAMIARTLAQAGVGMLLMRKDQAEQGKKDGVLALSPLEPPSYAMYYAHLATRRNDPLVLSFMEAVATQWPDIRLHG